MLENLYSHLTAKERDKLSFPARIVAERRLLKGKALDFGCGFGSDANLLSKDGFDILKYDKHYFPELPKEQFDTILCFYVLNVLMPEEQAEVLIQISRLLKLGGKAYFAVRRDLKNDGFRIHKLYQKPTYQCRVKLPFKSIFINDSCEIYEYQHFNFLADGKNENCPFCNPDKERELIAETATAYAIYDKYPVNKGHALIIPKRHCANYFDLSFREQNACMFLVNQVQKIIQAELNPNGFNIGINVNESAGQTIFHVHIHLIPRFKGDMENPRGGVRGVIPNKRIY